MSVYVCHPLSYLLCVCLSSVKVCVYVRRSVCDQYVTPFAKAGDSESWAICQSRFHSSNIILNIVRVSGYGRFGLRVECRGPSVVTIALRKSGRRCNICCTFENDNIAQFEILEH